MLEPSAGTGALAAFAARAGATLLLNEIDPFRQRLLRAVFGGEVTGHDGEHIDDLLQTPVLPDVVVMNPPFASSVDRSRDKHIAAKHLIAAAKRLAPGGRLVAIMPPGFTPERDAAHWSRACGLLTPRLALTMRGRVSPSLGPPSKPRSLVSTRVRGTAKLTPPLGSNLTKPLLCLRRVGTPPREVPRLPRATAPPNPGQPSIIRPRPKPAVPLSPPPNPRPRPFSPPLSRALEPPPATPPFPASLPRSLPHRTESPVPQDLPPPSSDITVTAVAPPPPPAATATE